MLDSSEVPSNKKEGRYTYDESGRPYDPTQGYARTYDALAGKQNMVRTAIIDAKRLSTRIPIPLLTGDPSRVGLNPGVAISPQGEMVVCLRTLPSGGSGTTGARTVNKIGRISDGKLMIAADLKEPASIKSMLGFEDVRLFYRGDELHGIATVALSGGQSVGVAKADVVTFRIVGDQIVEEKVIASPRYERNWMPVAETDVAALAGLAGPQRFIYSTDPLVVVTAASDIAALKISGTLRGGSQVVAFGSSRIAVVHEVAGGSGKPVEYTHRFVVFDVGISSVKIGKPFFFQKRGIEFASGLVVTKDDSGEHLWIAYGVEDKRAFLAEVPDDTLKEVFPS